MLSWSYINDSQDREDDSEEEEPSETSEAREARHNAAYGEALALHGEGGPNSEEWKRAKKLYDTVISDRPAPRKSSSSAVSTPVRFLCLKNLADMLEREGEDERALELHVAAAEEDATDLAVWLKMARLARRSGLSNLARFALERLLETREDHVFALRTLRDVLLEIGDAAAVREVTSRLLRLDPYWSPTSDIEMRGEKAVTLGHGARNTSRSDEFPSDLTPANTGLKMASNSCVERTLESPSWERLGRLLLNIRASICGGKGAVCDPPATTITTTAATNKAEGSCEGRSAATGSGGEDIGQGGSAVVVSAAQPGFMPTFSTPVRIVVPPSPDRLEVLDPVIDRSGDVVQDAAGRAEIMDPLEREQQRQELLRRRRPRRPSVERAMEWYSDGSSSDDSGEDEEGKSSGRKMNASRGGERRTSARRQRQDEMREANVAAARENDMQFRVASLFVPSDEKLNGRDVGPPAEKNGDETAVWWPHLAAGGRVSDGTGDGEEGEAADGDAEGDGAALASKMLPRWRRRHDVDCRRCGSGGIVLCCDFCHLVYHPRCLEATPSLDRLFACAECQEEAANREWELKDREAAAEAVGTGLKELLRAAGGKGRNAGVIDLMLRWLQGIAVAQPGELCPDSALHGTGAGASLGGLANPEAGKAGAATLSHSSLLAGVALEIETFVRGYLPARISWPVLGVQSDQSPTQTPAFGGVDAWGGPELGLQCELMLAEMHVDRALTLTHKHQRTAATAAHAPASALAGAGTESSPTSALTVTVNGDSGGKKSDQATDVGPRGGAVVEDAAAASTEGGSGAAGKRADGRHGKSSHARRREAADHLAAADWAMLQLEPWLLSVAQRADDEGARGSASAGPLHGAAAPWTLAARWWWLKGLRARQDGRKEHAFECLRLCESVLKKRERSGREDSGEERLLPRAYGKASDPESPEEAVIVLPYCTLHPRIDLQVVRSVVTDMELSGTSEAARESFTRAICLLSECRVTPSPGSKAAVEASTVTKTAAEAKTNQKRVSSEDQKGQGETSSDGRSVGKSVGGAQSESVPVGPSASPGSATTGSRANGVQQSPSALSARGCRSIEGDIAPAGSDNQIASPSSGADKVIPSAGAGAQVPTSTPKDKAMAALAAVMRGLESRFVVQQSPPSVATPVTSGVHVAASVANATTGSEGERGELLAGSCGKRVDGGSSVSSPAEYGGWSAWIRPTRAEEILADLLEREKGRFAHVNRDGARVIEKWTAADGRALSTPPMYFISRARAVSSVPTVGAGATTVVSSVRTAPSQRNSSGGSGKPSGTSRAITRAPKASTTAPRPDTKVDIRRQRQRHYPISLSAPGLGENASIFSMMLRGAALLDRHELAVLLAVRCADHFLDACDVLGSPRGPLGIAGRRSRPPGKDGGRGGGIGNEGFGAVHLLLTTRDTGNDRRVVDTALKSACAEFLVHALTVTLWAVPYATRVELFGLGTGGIGREDVGHSHGSGMDLERRASVRRRSVLRCLSRLLKHSVDSENTRVLNLVVCAWQAIAAVTPSVLTASHRQSQGQSIPLQTAGILGLPVGAKGVRQVDEEAKRRALNAMGIESGASQCLGSGESRARAFVGGRGSTGRESDTAENTPEGMQSKDVFDDPLRALVRCLCGVVVRRWKEASSAGKSPKKVWVSHVMEAVLALTRAIEYHRLTVSASGVDASSSTPGPKDFGKSGAAVDNPAACGSNHTSGLSSSAGTPDDEYGKVAYRSHFFASAGETKEIVSALMGLSQLCDDAATPSATSMSSTPKAGSGGGGGAAGSLSGGGGSSGGGGGGSGSGGGNSGGSGTSGGGNASGGAGGGAGATGGGSGTPGNRGVKLICSLAILAIGLSDATSLLTTRQRIGLVEALHDHLKGRVAAPVTLGDVPDSSQEKGGVCADRDGVFLKAALLYLSSEEVTTEVEKDEAEARQAESSSSSSSDVEDEDEDEDEDPSESMFNDHSSDNTIDVGGGSDEEMNSEEEDGGKSGRLAIERDQVSQTGEAADGEGRDRDRGGAGAGAEGVSISGGEKKGPGSKRCERLEERVIRAVAQCQACLYGVALVPCADHRCLTPPRPPSTALEAHALYIFWEDRLPDLRRSQALRLLEGVISHETFSSPPPTRFSGVIDKLLFVPWTAASGSSKTDGVGVGELEEMKGESGDGSGSGEGVREPQAPRGSDSPPDQEVSLEELLGLRLPARRGIADADTVEGVSTKGGKKAAEVLALSSENDGVESGEQEGDRNNDRSFEGSISISGPGVTHSKALRQGGVYSPRRDSLSPVADVGRKIGISVGEKRKKGRPGEDDEACREQSAEGTALLPPEMEPFSRVYLGLYRNLADAKGVPSGSISRTLKSTDEVADTEASLMQGIRWRVLDLSVCPNRMSSWKGLAQCACRLAAIYLDAFPPWCHRLGMPLTSAPIDLQKLSKIAPADAATPLGKDAAAANVSSNASPRSASAAIGGDDMADEEILQVDAEGDCISITAATGSGNDAGGNGSGHEKTGFLPVPMEAGEAAHHKVNVSERAGGTESSDEDDQGRDGAVDVSESNCSGVFPSYTGILPHQTPQRSLETATEQRTGNDEDVPVGEHCARERALSSGNTARVRPLKALDEHPQRSIGRPNPSSPDASSDQSAAAFYSTEAPSPVTTLEDDLAQAISGETSSTSEGGLGSEDRCDVAKGMSVLGLRAVPGPHLGAFFQGTALDAKAARKEDGSNLSVSASGQRVSRVAAISSGLRRMKARTEEEAASAENMASRISDGTATHEEWNACLGHASIASAVAVAETSFVAWKALAVDALARARKAVRLVRSGTRWERRNSERARSRCDEAARELAECCEEEGFMKYMLARDVWMGFEDATSADTVKPAPAMTTTGDLLVPVGLEVVGRRELMESSLRLLRRARYLRETGGIPSLVSTRISGRRRRRPGGAPSSPKELSGPRKPGDAAGDVAEEEDRWVASGRSPKRSKLSVSVSIGSGPGDDDDGDNDDDDEFRWQAPFVMGRLCIRLSKHPRLALENLSRALHLAKAEGVPLEDELEARCRLHVARAEMVLSGSVEDFSAIAAIIDAYAFREDGGSSTAVGEAKSVEAFPVRDDSPQPGGNGGERREVAKAVLVGVGGDMRRRRLAALDNCLDAFDSCIKKQRGQHTAVFATANALYRGAKIAEEAFASSIAAGVPFSGSRRSFGPQAALLSIKPIFEKRQQLLLAMSGSDGVVGPGLALLGTRRRKLHSLRRKYVGLYVELLQVSKNAVTLQGLLRRTRAPRETRDEMLWVQGTVLRALVAILRSEVAQFPRVTPLVHSPSPLPSATGGSSSLPNRSPSTSPPPQPAASSTGIASTDSTAAPVVPASPGAPKASALEGSSNSGSGGDTGATVQAPPALTMLPSQGQTTEGASRDSSQLMAQAGTQTTEDSHNGDGGGGVARATITTLASASAPALTGAMEENSTSSGSSGVGEQEKRVLERAWDLYLQVVDLASSARGGSAVALRVDAEEVLVKSWQAFGRANTALLELVELQNPVPSSSVGAGAATGSSGMDLRRAQACCHMLWPDKQGKGKVSKSKLKLKRPATSSSSTSSANRSAPRPKIARPTASTAAESAQTPATAESATVEAATTAAAAATVGTGKTTASSVVRPTASTAVAAPAPAPSPTPSASTGSSAAQSSERANIAATETSSLGPTAVTRGDVQAPL